MTGRGCVRVSVATRGRHEIVRIVIIVIIVSIVKIVKMQTTG